MLAFSLVSVDMRFFKKFVVILLTFLLLISVFFWLLTRTVHLETLKNYVTTKIRTYTGQTCEIRGDIHWQLFPRPSIKIGSIHIGNKSVLNPYQVNLGQLFFNLKLSALFQGKIVFNEIKITRLAADIDTNYKQPPIHALQKIPTNPSLENNIDENFSIERILITNGKVKAHINNQLVVLDSLQLRAEQINLEQNLIPFQVKTTVNYDLNQQPASAQLQFKGDANLTVNSINQLEHLIKSSIVHGQLLIQNLQIGRFKISQINANTLFKNAIFSLNPLTLKLYQGEAIGDLSYNFLSKILKINQTATGVNGARLTIALFSQPLVKGKLDLSLHSQANFNNPDWLATAIGNGNISLNQGTLEVLDLDKIVKKISNKISKAQENKESTLTNSSTQKDSSLFKGTTPLKLLSIQYRLAHKMLLSDNLLLQTNMLQLKGDGEINLTNYNLISHLLATLTVEDSKLNEVQELIGGGFPLIIQGDLDKVIILPDFKKINASLAKLWIKNTLAKPVLKIKEQLVAFFNH